MGAGPDIDAMKRAAAEAALRYVRDHALIGVGHGSTAAAFVEALAASGHVLKAAVAASEATARLLREHGVAVVPLAEVRELPVYVDGCDEADRCLRLLKGVGGAHTREKLTAMRAALFVCAADETKLVERLGRGPVAVEVTPHALDAVAEALRDLGGDSFVRPGFLTDDGNPVLDVTGLDVGADPAALEREIDAIPGVVDCGIFALRRADVLLLGTSEGVRTLRYRR
ncbi:MAG: ribose-5-phosphate isomerase RpiA [Coriobacteriia bacterium]|nr:ribose-5-phosphate isomerase RpiA [Coriobacteriia bacterium]